MADFRVTAPCVQIAAEKTGQWSHFYEGAVIAAGFNDGRCKELVAEKMLEVVTSEASASKGPTVEEILDQVGADKELAAVALEEEKAGKNRKTLVEKLEAIVSASPGDGQ